MERDPPGYVHHGGLSMAADDRGNLETVQRRKDAGEDQCDFFDGLGIGEEIQSRSSANRLVRCTGILITFRPKSIKRRNTP